MSEMIESMESRTLLSASATVIANDFAVLRAKGLAARADLIAALATATADVRAVKLDVVTARPTKAQRVAFNTFRRGEVVAAAKYKHTIAALLATGVAREIHLVSRLVRSEFHPGNLVLQAKVGSATAALQAVFSATIVNAVETAAAAAVTTLDADLDAVATAVPSATTDVGTTKASLATDLGTLSSDAAAIQADIATLAGDLA